MLLLNRREVEALLDLDRLVESLAAAMAELSAGRVSMPARVAALVPDEDALLAAMPAYLDSSRTLSVKLVSVFPGNDRRGLPSHQAVVVVFDASTGSPLAMMDGTYITSARTAAGSALATRLVARPDADVLAVICTGVQARAHARAIPRVRAIREIRVAGRNREKVEAFAREISGELKIPARAFQSAQEAAKGAGIVCATTHSPEPVVKGSWLEPGMHVNSVGFNPQGREVDGEALARSLVVVESRQAALAPFPSGSNDLAWAIRDGLITAEHIHAEVGELVSGARPGRTSPDQITFYKSVGVAVQDAVAAHRVLAAAREQGVGREVEI